MGRLALPLLIFLSAFATIASAQHFPLWERILKHYSGTTDETPVPAMKMGHMQHYARGMRRCARPVDSAGA